MLTAVDAASTSSVRAARAGKPQPRHATSRKAGTTAISPVVVSVGAVTIDVALIALLTILARLAYGDDTALSITALSGAGMATFFLAVGLARRDYGAAPLINGRDGPARAIAAWLLAFALALVVTFLTKTTADYSRGANGLLLVSGAAILPLSRFVVARQARRWAAAGRLVVKRIMLVGHAAAIDAFMTRYEPAACGLDLVSAAVLREEAGSTAEDLALAVAIARMRRPDELFLLLPWDDQALIARSIDALQKLPAAIHLGPTALLERYAHLRVEQAGNIASVRLIRQPLSAWDRRLKRALDVTAASLALILLCPLFLAIAVLIKLDGPGPVFFRQRRTGYNQQPFRIFKFRSMRTMEDDATLRQVTTGDARVTAIGRVLRRTSLDELPQLINVLKGEMSLIGPRPHALAHDQAFGRSHALYDRRHAIRPGITGWAQVRGFRGETDTSEKIEGRVRHDLDYIDNWSIWFDLEILARTVFSPQTFRNAK